MVYNKIFLNELYNIKLNDSVLAKIEDAKSKKENIVVTIDASHYGFLNKNNTIYRHDTVRDCIPSFVYPDTKPIIENHRPRLSDKFGRVIAADYRETKYYNDLINKGIHLENLTTEQYMCLCKDTIIPMQDADNEFNGIAFCQVVGKIDHKDGIQKILDSEFLHVSIGAIPKRLICSECGQDQMVKICDHYPRKGNGIFMLAEELEYEELSFVPKPADRSAKITFIHDGIETQFEVEPINIKADVDIILAKDFFKLADGKKIICMDNICKVINEPEEKMRKQKEGQKVLNISYVDEFSAEQLKDIKLNDSEDQELNIEESLKLSDEVMGELTNRDFAIVQRTDEGVKRRFPIHNTDNLKAAIQLIGTASDITDSEKDKAITSISRAAKKAGIEFKIEDETQDDNTKTDEPKISSELESALAVIKDSIEKVEFEEKEDGTIELKDTSTSNPINEVFNMLVSFAGNLRWAGEALNDRVTYFLTETGKTAIEKGVYDSVQEENKTLKDSIAEKDEEIAILEDQNMELNYSMRASIVEEIISSKTELAIADSDPEAEKASLMKLPYDVLVKQKNDFNKLKLQLKTNTVNNNTKDIKTIVDPTLNDDDTGGNNEDTTLDDPTLEDSEKKPSEQEIVQAFINLFRNR